MVFGCSWNSSLDSKELCEAPLVCLFLSVTPKSDDQKVENERDK